MEEDKKISGKRKHPEVTQDNSSLDKHEPNNSQSTDQRSFEEKYNDFIKHHKEFFEMLSHENSVMLVKNSPYQAFGNYENYYRLRCSQRWEDPRTKVIRREWIHDRKCLDIGCNEGIVTIILAVRYQPKVIVGCDIDYTLINKAISHLRSLEKNKTMIEEIGGKDEDTPKSKRRKELLKRLQEMPKSFTIGLSLPFEPEEETKNNAWERLIFRQENYIADMDTIERYDTILCLSTIKWIHLHYGDAGVKALFYKVYKTLNKEGIFVFEPQPWKSYKKKKHLDETMKKQYKEIKLTPDKFEDYLVNVIGFKVIERVVPEGVKKGYNSRSILILKK